MEKVFGEGEKDESSMKGRVLTSGGGDGGGDLFQECQPRYTMKMK